MRKKIDWLVRGSGQAAAGDCGVGIAARMVECRLMGFWRDEGQSGFAIILARCAAMFDANHSGKLPFSRPLHGPKE
jgi:hypothetical protein